MGSLHSQAYNLFGKEVFVSVIESIRLQLHKDKEHADSLSNSLSNAFDFKDCSVGLYDNSLLIKSLVSLLQLRFPKKDGFCAIEHYMFDLNFGKCAEFYISPEDLWNQLNREPMVSTHSLIDDFQ